VVQVLRCFARLFVRLGSDSLPNPSTTTFAICKASGVRFERIFFSWLDLRGLEHRSYMRRVDEILLLLLTCTKNGVLLLLSGISLWTLSSPEERRGRNVPIFLTTRNKINMFLVIRLTTRDIAPCQHLNNNTHQISLPGYRIREANIVSASSETTQ
jgi:hypothetical protein